MINEIDSRVTPSLNPNTVHNLDGYDDDTASIPSGVESAFAEAYIGLGASIMPAQHLSRTRRGTMPLHLLKRRTSPIA